jgi:predicted nicotinamide N-methyase
LRKQVTESHIINYLGLKILKSSHPDVRKIKRQQHGHSAHGNKVWRSSFALIDYLETYPLKKHSKVLEIGCGWGLNSLYLTKHQKVDITAIDIDDSVKPYFELQNSINQCHINFQQRSFESLKPSEMKNYHYVIGSDICFWNEMTKPLFRLIDLSLSSGVQKLMIADPGRPPFWELTEKCAKKFDSEVITRRIYKPWKSEKYILVIRDSE